MADSAGGGGSRLNLAAEFPPVPTEVWEQTIQADLKGADYEKRLVWRTPESIAVRPYYREGDATPSPVRAASNKWSESAPASEGVVDGARFLESGANAVEELAFTLAVASDALAAGSPVTGLRFAVGSNYFFEIAKLRAARLLWSTVAEAYGVPATIAIHAVTTQTNKSLYDPYTNLLRCTTEALSAAIAGVDSLEVREAGFSARLAGNVQLVLREEVHLDHVADPAGGSYYIEAITSSLAQQAWKLFQEIEAAGGFTKAGELVEARLTAGRSAREKEVASRRRTLVGVNNYPDLKERELEHSAWIDSSAWRMPAAVEAVRLRTERHAAKHGSIPRVLLLKRGDVKMKMARAQFCQNFFGCAGFDIVESESLEPADLVVLCSSDPEYLALASEICPQAGATPVIVAGNPAAQIEALNAAGVAGYVHLGSNLVEALTFWQDKLNLSKEAK